MPSQFASGKSFAGHGRRDSPSFRPAPRKLVNVPAKSDEELSTDEFLKTEVDPILDKISAHGIQSLTAREREILEKARAKMANIRLVGSRDLSLGRIPWRAGAERKRLDSRLSTFYAQAMITRYSRPEMRAIWTDENKLRIWLQIELLASEALVKEGVVPEKRFRQNQSRRGQMVC